MAEDERTEAVVVQRKEPRSTLVPSAIFAICMIAFIAFIFWQFGIRGTSWVGVSQNNRDVPVTAPNPLPN